MPMRASGRVLCERLAGDEALGAKSIPMIARMSASQGESLLLRDLRAMLRALVLGKCMTRMKSS